MNQIMSGATQVRVLLQKPPLISYTPGNIVISGTVSELGGGRPRGIFARVGKNIQFETCAEGKFCFSFPLSKGLKWIELDCFTSDRQMVHLSSRIAYSRGIRPADMSSPALSTPLQGLGPYSSSPPKDVKGINYYGFVGKAMGLGSAARNNISALRQAQFDVLPLDLPLTREKVSFDAVAAQSPAVHPLNIYHFNPDYMSPFFNNFGYQLFRQKYNIGFWVWELEDLPSDWTRYFGLFDEIWTPSQFSRKAIQRHSPIPVRIFPHIIEEIDENPTFTRPDFHLPAEPFIFLYIFDMESFFERKNPLALVEAFHKAFGNRKDVLLVLKTYHTAAHPEKIRMLERASQSSNIHILDKNLTEEELSSLIQCADCYVSPHRSEGFGLTPAEAMYLGKPVIATDYGATTEFISSENGYPVECKTVTIQEDCGAYRKGMKWAEPSVEHLASLLIRVIEHPEEARAKANLGQKYIREKFSQAAAVRRIQEIFGDGSQLSKQGGEGVL